MWSTLYNKIMFYEQCISCKTNFECHKVSIKYSWLSLSVGSPSVGVASLGWKNRVGFQGCRPEDPGTRALQVLVRVG